MSIPPEPSDRALLAAFVQVVAARDVASVARQSGISSTTIYDWVEGRLPERLYAPARRKVRAFLREAAPPAVVRERPPTDAVSVVQELREIERMTDELARYIAAVARRVEAAGVSRIGDPDVAKSVHATRKAGSGGARRKA